MVKTLKKSSKTVSGMDVLEDVRGILSAPKECERTVLVELDHVNANPYQPHGRLDFPLDVVVKMADSIEAHGLILTPVVRPITGSLEYQMADGWLRLSGYRLLVQRGRKEYHIIPVIIRELTDQQMADMVIEANTVRQDLNPIELAQFYKRYLEDFKITQTELARVHNISLAQAYPKTWPLLLEAKKNGAELLGHEEKTNAVS